MLVCRLSAGCAASYPVGTMGVRAAYSRAIVTHVRRLRVIGHMERNNWSRDSRIHVSYAVTGSDLLDVPELHHIVGVGGGLGPRIHGGINAGQSRLSGVILLAGVPDSVDIGMQ